jgi:hypothetical protein
MHHEMIGESHGAGDCDMAMRRLLVSQIQLIHSDEEQAQLAEAMFRCKAGRITWATRIAYWVARWLHGEEKTSTLFTRFLLHARHVEKVDYIQRIIEQVARDLLAGKLDARQIHLIQEIVQRALSNGQLPKNG